MNRRPDVVLVGAGMVAGVHAAACDALGWRVRAVASRAPERAAELASKVGARAVTCEQLVAARLGDLAIVATPPSRHVDDAVALLDAGYHVVVEAPLSCTLTDADRLLAAEERVGRSVLYSEHLASAPVVDTLLSRVSGIGAVTHLSARSVQGPPSWRGLRADDRSRAWGGGALFDLGVHPIGLVIRTGAEAGIGAPVSVSAVVNDSGTDHERATVKLHFEAGTTATVNVGWQPGAAPDGDLQVSSARAVLRAELYPSPTLEANGERVAVTSTGRSTVGPSLVEDYGYAPQLRRFWTNIRTGRPVPATSRFGRQVLDVVCAAHESAAAGAVDVELPFAGPRDRTPFDLLSDRAG